MAELIICELVYVRIPFRYIRCRKGIIKINNRKTFKFLRLSLLTITFIRILSTSCEFSWTSRQDTYKVQQHIIITLKRI